MCSVLLFGVLAGPALAGNPPQVATQGSTTDKRCTDAQGKDVACPTASPQRRTAIEWSVPRNILLDQKEFWTTPARVRPRDLRWILPFTGFTAGLISADTAIERKLPSSPTLIKRSSDFSNVGVAALAGAAGGLYLWGRTSGDSQRRETGVLSAEAAADSFIAAEAFKLATRRARPQEDDLKGRFWDGGDSFPSEHAAAAWSIASVIAHEYPGPLTKLLAYGVATGVTATRVTGRRHFSSDVFVGSALGWYLGRQVYRSHHDGGDGANFGTFQRGDESGRTIARTGSTYVPLDSWVYAAFDRLSARGYVQSGFVSLRPWTRLECARLVTEAEQGVADELSAPSEITSIVDSLRAEFAPELRADDDRPVAEAAIESLYVRMLGISGPPLNDAFHFGQTVINDYGRPSREGTNAIVGVSSRAYAGPLAFYIRGEYQHAPLAPAVSDPVRAATAVVDGTPVLPGSPFAAVNRFDPIEAYVGLNLGKWQLSFGKQAQWWGPEKGGPFLFSNNADSIPMLRFDRTQPFQLPGFLRWLGKIRVQLFWGQLQGYQFVSIETADGFRTLSAPIRPHPYIHGEKLSFKLTPNFEFSVSETAVFGGPGFPLTWHNFIRSYGLNNETVGAFDDPGDRRAGFDFSYRVPGLRNWLVLYNDAFAEDEMSPIGYPRRSAQVAGIYMPRIPRVPKLDLRVEGVYTDLPNLRATGMFYSNFHFNSGYTNRGVLLGNWVGREGRGVQAWSTYHFSARNTVQLGFRSQTASPDFLEGGRLRDISARAQYMIRPDLELLATVQGERWSFPLLGPGPQTNVTASFQLTFRPNWVLHSSH